MEIRILGDLSIDGGPLSPKERSLLAALVLRAGMVVTPSELADAVWRDELPTTWPKQVQASIGHIRRALGPGSIITSRAGYRLGLASDAVDAARYQELIATAREHVVNGDPLRAINLLERASELWRGVPYSDLGEWPPAIAEAERLDEIRLSAEEDLQAARIDTNEHRLVVPDAEKLVRAQPLRERRWAILATALYRAGRQADALAALREARSRLAEELGIDPGAELTDLEASILRQDPELDAPPAAQTWQGECPYRGLQAFGTDDAEQFFGREDDVRSALDRLGSSNFLVITGPSGCGKSSMVRAGLVPGLRDRGRVVTVLGSGQVTVARLRDALSARSRADVIVVDQFEELFHSALPTEETAAYSAVLADAVGPDRTVIVCVRSDFLDACAAEPSIGPLFAENVHLLRPITPDGLRRAIENPARLAGLRLENGLVELILRDAAGEPGALPHASHALVETWLRREGATLTVAGYEASGGISGAIAQSANRLYASLDSTQQAICRSMMLRLVEIAADGSPVRRRIRLKPLREDAAHDTVLSRLARARLVSAEEDSLVIAHESLATAWPRLRDWLAEDADGARMMHAVTGAAAAWEAEGRPDEDLLHGVRLHATLEWRDAAKPELTGSERDFLDASIRHEQAEAAVLADRARRDRRQNRQLRTLLGVAIGLLVLSVAATSVVVGATQETARQRESAVVEATVATSAGLRSSERDVAALLAVEAYRRWPDDARSRGALLGMFTAADGFLGNRYITGADRIAGAVIPGTENAVVVRDNESAAVVDLNTGHVLRELAFGAPPAGCCGVPFVRVSADGDTAVILRPTDVAPGVPDFPGLGASRNSELLSIDLGTGDLRHEPIPMDLGTGGMELSPGGRVAAVTDTGSYRRVDLVYLDSGRSKQVPDLPGGASTTLSPPSAIAFMPDGQLVVGGTGDRMAIVDPARAEIVGSIRVPTLTSNVALAPTGDGGVIAAGDRALVAIDIATGAVRWTRPFATAQPTPCAWIGISTAMSTVYCADLWGGIEERSLQTGEPTGQQLDPQLGAVGPVMVSVDGHELYAFGAGSNAVSRWRLDGSGPVTRIVARGSAAVGGYSPDGTRIITAKRLPGATEPGELTDYSVWDPDRDVEVLHVPGTAADVGWAGTDALVGLFDAIDRVGFLDASTGQPLTGDPINLTVHRTWLLADGTRLYTADADGTVTVVDGSTHRQLAPEFKVDGVVHSISADEDASMLAVTTSKDGETSTVLVDGRSGTVRPGRLVGPELSIITSRRELVASDDNRLTRYAIPGFTTTGSLPGAQGGLTNLQVSADGGTLIAGANDETVGVYDLPGGIRLGDPIATSSPLITPAYLRPDGRTLIVNQRDGVAVWDLDPDHQQEAACRLAGRDLTKEEWATYLGSIDTYRSTCGFSE